MATQSKFYADLGIKSLTNAEVDGNLTVGGDLTVSGTHTTIDSTTKSVADSMIELASGNTTADLLDIGIYGNYNDGLSGESGVSEYTGLFRDASDSTWKLFDGLEVEPTTTVNLSGGNYALADLKIGDLAAATLDISGNVDIDGVLETDNLTVGGAQGSDGQVLTSTGSGVAWEAAAAADGITATGSNTIIQSPDDTSVAYINNTGYFGINHDNPAGRLHVAGHTSIIPSIFESNGNGDTVPLQLKVKANNGTTSTQGLFGNAGSVSTDNTITLGSSSTSGILVTGDGKVGIGDTSPSETLSVSASGGANLFVGRDGTTGGLYIESDGTNGVIRNPANNPLQFQTNGANTRMQIDANGTIQFGDPAVGGAANVVIMPQGKLYLDAGGDTYIQESAGNVMDFYAGGNRKIRVDPNGLIFGTDTAAANALDDYEEGTFTPSYTVGGGGSVVGVTSTNTGSYTKVGRMCTVSIHSSYVQTTGTIPTNYTVSLPFQAHTGGVSTGFGVETGQSGKGLLIQINSQSTTAAIWTYISGAVPANSYFALGFTYQTV